MNKVIIRCMIKILLFTLLIFFSINYNTYAMMDFETIIERYYDEVEIDGEIFYTRKKLFTPENSHVPYVNSNEPNKQENQEIVKIINEKSKEYFKQFTLESYPIDKRIAENFSLYTHDIYFSNDKLSYKSGDDINALIMISAKPIQGNSNYWNENFSKNELYYNEFDKTYHVTMYYFVRLSINSESNQYEVIYMGLEPENLNDHIKELEEKGINLKDLNIEKVVNTQYTDEIKLIPSSETISINAEKNEYDNIQIEEVSNITTIIRITCICLLFIITIIGIIKVWKKT